jgi:uncharacterized membrane protein YfcA
MLLTLTSIWVFLIVFVGIFVQGVAGFGLALVMMPLLSQMLGVTAAAPLVALIAAVAELSILMRYRQAVSLSAIWRLALAAMIAVPLGVWGLHWLPPDLALTGLGLVVMGYAIYALLRLHLPKLNHPSWAYFFGFWAGLLSGAYNTSGPAYVIYGSCRRWEPAEFKGNLQGVFLISGATTIFSHALAGHYTPEVWQYWLLALPAVALGLWVGGHVDKKLDPQMFRQLVLWLLLLIGLRLLWG